MAGCGAEWDPRRCPACGHADALPEAICARCGISWDPSQCPSCKASSGQPRDLAEELYYDAPEGLFCRACRREWRPSRQGESERCPSCSSTEIATSYPEIPEPGPRLQIILWAEGCIPRAENGAILHREMLSWLRFHGVRDRGEQQQWESWFGFIGGVRARMVEEMMAPKDEGERDPEREE